MWIIGKVSVLVERCRKLFVYNLIASHLRKPNLPNIGLILTQPVNRDLSFDHRKMCLRLEDVFITGMLRERIEGSSVSPIAGGPSGYLWNNYLSYSPVLSSFSNIFLNDIVMEKNFYVKSLWFFSCSYFEEYVLAPLDFLLPHDFIPNSLVKLCLRPMT